MSNPVNHCHIYTRKSSEEGLEQEYNSLDAQQDAREASQRHSSPWTSFNSGRPIGRCKSVSWDSEIFPIVCH